MANDAWNTLNKKAITYIKMVVYDENLVDIKGLITAHQVWEKLKTNYKITTPMNQVRLIRKRKTTYSVTEHYRYSQVLSPNYKIQEYQLFTTSSKLSSYDFT